MPVLIRGESGTGKELVARAIRRLSGRRARGYQAINCEDFTPEVLRSELFGHERGAFTGAVGKKEGLLPHVDGGTVFLDEIGELSPLWPRACCCGSCRPGRAWRWAPRAACGSTCA